MKKQNRVLKNIEFRNVLKKGKRYYSHSFKIYFVRNTIDLFQIGISVSKKVSKLAVVRNKVKRRIDASIREYYIPNENIKVIFICNPGIENKSYDEINEEVSNFFKKIRKGY
ncbi:MAG: ribonuclease P protein component [Mycoplasma sp.]